jgi:hypothetical protein
MEKKNSQLFDLSNRIKKLKRLLVVGDLHGDFHSLCNIIDIFDPKQDFIIFLGDYADRGSFGVEVIEKVKDLPRKHPKNVLLLKGNHEDFTKSGKPNFFPCNLCKEVEKKRGEWQEYFRTEFKDLLQALYLSAIIKGEIFFVHGGISNKINKITDLYHPKPKLAKDLIWSDPFEGFGEFPNIKRGGSGVIFGRDITKRICEIIKVKKIIRGHEPRKALYGPTYTHNRQVITVNSSRVFGGFPFALSIKIPKFSKIKTILLK